MLPSSFYRPYFIVLAIVALYLTWSNNLQYFREVIPVRYPSYSRSERLFAGFRDFFFVDSKPNPTAVLVLKSLSYELLLSMIFFYSFSIRAAVVKGRSMWKGLLEATLFTIFSIGVAISATFPLYIAYYSMDLFNFRNIRVVYLCAPPTPSTSSFKSFPKYLSYSVMILSILLSFAAVIFFAPLLIQSVFSHYQKSPSLIAALFGMFDEAMVSAVSRSLAWDVVILSLAMASLIVFHGALFFRWPSLSTIIIRSVIIIPLLTVLLMGSGAAQFAGYLVMLELLLVPVAHAQKAK